MNLEQEIQTAHNQAVNLASHIYTLIPSCPNCHQRLPKKLRAGSYRCQKCKHKTRTPELRPPKKQAPPPRRNILKVQIPTRTELLYALQQIINPEHRAICTTFYLLAARSNEICRTILRKQIKNEIIDNRKSVVFHQLPTLKKRGNIKGSPRTVALPIDTEGEYIKLLIEHLDSTPPNNYAFAIHDRQAYKIVTKYFPHLWPHALRHIRITHLRSTYNWAGEDIQIFVGWTDTKPAAIYQHLNYKDMLTKFPKPTQEENK